MSDMVLQLSVLSVVCGALMSIMPQNGCRSALQILCAVALINCIVSPVLGFDFESFALESARLHEAEAAFSGKAVESRQRLDQLVIHQQYREYILDKASQLGLGELELELNTQWNEEGFWVPYSVEFRGCWEEYQQQKLKQIITDELGIPEERQQWQNA